ncbi:acyl-CoA thioesterase [Colwellia demingiae]|uniref:Acyl-CoA thioesterase n=1 Tax=Colwellia demingiae TaxID=89401 RepID=A0A5C6Q613_9GAMM|nr:thioesterase family protein [Colwellia demingiae]TWX64141.1 acyl-CoA thioesterase [Colwellia demingiae]
MSHVKLVKDDFHFIKEITTRWMDNDIFGHVNNVTYYSYFDTIANTYLIERVGIDFQTSPVIAFIVNSQCSYFSSVAYPDKIVGAFRVNRIGNSSVEYGVAIFKEGQESVSAYGTMTHVFVDRKTEKPVKIEGMLREVLEQALKK